MQKNIPHFPVVGVGASAGGLDAYRKFLLALPPDSGAAFVFIQHLDPNHESMMADLLSRHTSMPVVQAQDDMRVEPNTVYMIPPNKFLKLVDDGLFLDEPTRERGVRLTIDYFFRSLAEVRGERSIGVVLSGTGSDGSLGVRDIKAAGGMVMVQDPKTAEYDGMPRAAINAGGVDFVLPVEEMGQTLTNFIGHSYQKRAEGDASLADLEADHFRSVLDLLRARTDYDFSRYKKGTLERRIQRRMSLRQIGALSDYVASLRSTPDEVEQLFRDILIGVTRFFREPETWEALKSQALSRIIEEKSAGQAIRAWTPGCSSGEEAFTLAIMMFEAMEEAGRGHDLKIFATDLDQKAIATARTARYPASIAADVPPDLLAKYFEQEGDNFTLKKRVREVVVFAPQNVISDPPFSWLDIITCRNLLIYLETEAQQKLIEMFHFALQEDGYLLLGSSESADRPGGCFEPVSKKHRIYRRGATVRKKAPARLTTPSQDWSDARLSAKAIAGRAPTGAEFAKRVLLARFAPAAVLVNHRYEVLYFHGPLKNYLDFPSGEPNLELPAMATLGLGPKLRMLLKRASESGEPAEVTINNLPREGGDAAVRIAVEPVSTSGDPGRAYLVIFEDVSPPQVSAPPQGETVVAAEPEDASLVSQLETELKAAREELRSTVEEMETANEELKASSEEAMSMNEELQSTNEELETSREELQSLNEELSTVNRQLEEKIGELESANNDLSNLLASTDIATIFLDTELRIRRFTPAASVLLRIIDSDVGRLIEDLAPRVNDPALLNDAREVLAKLLPREAEVRGGVSHFIRRILPYRTSENKIEGVVVTFTDVSAIKRASERARVREQQQEAVAELGKQALQNEPLDALLERAVRGVSSHLNLRYAKLLELRPDGRSFLVRAGVGWREGIVGRNVVPADATSQAGYTLQRHSAVVVENFDTEKRFSRPQLLADHQVVCGASVIIGPVGEPWGVLGAHDTEIGRCAFGVDDVNFMQSVANTLWLAIAQRRAQEKVDEERQELKRLADALPFQISQVSPEERYRFNNQAYEEWGVAREDVHGMGVRELMGDEAYAVAAPHIQGALRGESARFELEIRREGSAPRTNLVTYTPRRDASGALDGFYAAAIDISQQKETERALAERTAQYASIGEAIPYGVWICDAEGKLTYVSQLFLDLIGESFETVRDYGWANKLAPGEAEPMLASWRDCVERGGDWDWEHRFVAANGEIRTVLAMGRPIRDDAGRIISWAGLNLDITERKRKEERLSLISGELDHRVKNILQTVSSMVRMTGRNATDLGAYQSDLEARIRAMARAHMNLAESAWVGMPLGALIEEELAPYRDSADARVEFSGPDLRLGPIAAQSLALAIHELTTNAAKYGALSVDGGRLSVEWGREPAPDGAAPDEERPVWLRWSEDGLQDLQAPTRRGFGSTVISDVLASQLYADVEMTYRPTGLLCDITLPGKWLA